MSCTTILVGRDASYDGSTIIARNEDSCFGEFDPKRFVVVKPADQPRTYTTVQSHLTVALPDDPLQYTAVPNADLHIGEWGEAGVNEANVAMSATETITTNERVLGADPLVEYVPAKGAEGEDGYEPAVPGGLGEEDFVTVVLPYITTAREGVERLGALLEEYGTYESNGVAFSDANEIWWFESVGGHHWIAKRVPDDCYVTMPNQLGIDEFDLDDAFGAQQDCMCSADLREFIARNHLDLSVEGLSAFDPRSAFGSHSDADHVYNTPRAWYMQRYFNPYDEVWDGPDADHKPTGDDIPWARQPERKITVEDIKYVLSSHYQGTEYDPYGTLGTEATRHLFRPIGINRQNHLAVMQIRPYRPQVNRAVQWLTYASNPFNALVPFFPNVDDTPAYLRDTTTRVTTETASSPRCATRSSPRQAPRWSGSSRRWARSATASSRRRTRGSTSSSAPMRRRKRSSTSSMRRTTSPKTSSRWNRRTSSPPYATPMCAPRLSRRTTRWRRGSRMAPMICSTACSTR